MKKLYLIIAALLLISCAKYPTPVPEISTVNFEKTGGTTTIFVSGDALFSENYMKDYDVESDYSDGMLKSIMLKCGWVNFELQFYYDNDIHYGNPKLIVKAEPNNTGEQRNFKLKLVNDMDPTSSRNEATVTVIQKGE